MILSKKSTTFTFSLAAGILILINAVLLGVVVTWFPWIMPTIPGTTNDAVPFASLTTIGLVCGAIIFLGSLMLRFKPANKKFWGILVIGFLIPTVIMGGGFIVGFILGIMGGIKAFRSKTGKATT